MIPQLHYYNPGHETVVLRDSKHYTPPTNVKKIMKDLALLPMWYAEPGDYVVTEEPSNIDFKLSIPEQIRPKVNLITKTDLKNHALQLLRMTAAPWGLSPQSIHLYNNLKERYNLNIDIPEWKNIYRQLTGRQTSAICLNKMRELLPDIYIPPSPIFFSDLYTLELWLDQNTGTYIIKTPYSSSGRGLLWIENKKLSKKDKEWIKGAIDQQGMVSVEQIFNKCVDFAPEFYSDGQGNVVYKGLSSFVTTKKGMYAGNILQNQDALKESLEKYSDKDQLQKILTAAIQAVQDIYSHAYKGYMGIDMLIYKDSNNSYNIHPCIEVNLRYTMGMAAIKLFKKYINKDAKGEFKVIYERDSKDLFNRHSRMKENNTLHLENNKIKKGYLSLCPVTENTNYIAYIDIE